jgi:hypothetical protein
MPLSQIENDPAPPHDPADPKQKYLFVSDIMNNVAVADSRGNVYTGEVDSGKRIPKFVPVK